MTLRYSPGGTSDAKDAIERPGRKTQRLEARLSAEQKETIEHAAGLEGRSISDFVVARAYEAARDVIREHEVMVLSPRDSRAFVEALLNPPAPSERLSAAFAAYRRGVDQGRITRA